MEKFCGTVFWDSGIWQEHLSEFTPCFQYTVLAWLPCAVLWLFSPIELCVHKKKSVGKLSWSFKSALKVIISIVLISTALFDISIVLLHLNDIPKVIYPVHILAPITRIMSYVLTIVLVMIHRKKNIHTSGVLFFYWFVLIVTGLIPLQSTIRVLKTLKVNSNGLMETPSWDKMRKLSVLVEFTLHILMFLLNCVSDGSLEKSNKNNVSPEQGASFLSKITFHWFDFFMWRGFRGPIGPHSVWELNEEDQTAILTEKFDECWNQYLEREKWSVNFKKKGSELHHLLLALYRTTGSKIWTTALYKLFSIILALGSPQILGILVGFMSSKETIEKGIFFALVLFLMSLTSAILTSRTSFQLYHLGLQVKGILSSAIYRKSLKMPFSAKDTATAGELINFMAVDTYRCFDSMSNLHVIWEGPLVVILTIVLLYYRIGFAALSALVVVIICAPLNVYFTKKFYQRQGAQMREKDMRIKMMNEILNGIKILKLYAWEKCFRRNVEEVRKREIVELKQVAKLCAVSYLIWSVFPILVIFSCFATYVLVDADNVLDSQTVFVVLSTITFLCSSISNFNLGINSLAQVWVSFRRIATYLVSHEIDARNVQIDRGSLAMCIKNGSFNWDGEGVFLRNINLEVTKGSLTAIVGSVGSGKSSLIFGLLGEMQKQVGSVNVDGSVAYIAQQAWIQNATLQENILFGKSMNRHLYQEVVHACALKPDIEILPGGDQTEIGEKGINLSGGQKQRIALARAVYANADIYLLDDPLSAVDAHVGKHIFDNVIGPKGLLSGKTRLLVTHAVSILPQIETIHVLVDGEIRERGTYQELIKGTGEFSEFLTKHISEMTDEDQLRHIEEIFNKEETAGRAVFERAISIRSTKSASTFQRSARLETDDKSESANSSSGNLVEKEAIELGTVNIGIYKKYFQKIGTFFGIISLIALFLAEVFSVVANLWVTHWSVAADARANRTYYLTAFALFGLGRVLAMFSGVWMFNWSSLNGAKKLHNQLLNTTIKLPMSFFDTTPLGRIMNRFSKDIEIVDMYLPTSIRLGAVFFFNVLGVVYIIAMASSVFIYALLGFAVFYYGTQKIYISTSRQLKRVESTTLSPIYSHFSESLSGIATIRAFGKQEEFTNQNFQKIDWNQKVTYAGVVANRWLSCRLDLMGSVVVLLTSLYAVLQRDNNVDPVIMGLSITYALNATVVLSYFVRMVTDIETNIVAVERIEEYSNLPKESECHSMDLDEHWPSRGLVEFENLKLRYRPGLDSILKGISFTIQPREKIGIVGRTGAGKSSLALALFRIIEAAGGKILIDEINIADLDLEALRRRLTIIPQEPVLFAGTIRSNLDPFEQYSDDLIWKVLDLSHLKFFVSAQPLGLLHAITEGGENLSIGQRQLICLARALLRKTKVLILDEATAAVDLDTDKLIQTTIRTEFSDCTMLIIAHRLHTILDSDKIVVLEDGEIVEFDLVTNLLRDTSSKFYKMAEKAGITRAELVVSTKL